MARNSRRLGPWLVVYQNGVILYPRLQHLSGKRLLSTPPKNPAPALDGPCPGRGSRHQHSSQLSRATLCSSLLHRDTALIPHNPTRKPRSLLRSHSMWSTKTDTTTSSFPSHTDCRPCCRPGPRVSRRSRKLLMCPGSLHRRFARRSRKLLAGGEEFLAAHAFGRRQLTTAYGQVLCDAERLPHERQVLHLPQ